MSLTARERHNPPPRRKSCAACIKAKRRCDFAVPACLRCSQRNIACHYPARNTRAQSVVPQTPQMTQNLLIEDSLSPSALAIADFNAVTTAIDSNFHEMTAFDLPLDRETLDLIHQPSMLSAPSSIDFEIVAYAITHRLQWSIDEIQRAPSKMVHETSTPWCHPLLYKDGMPRSMQDAHASCALYLAKNRVNAPVIMRSIEARAYDLLNSPAPTTARDCLAHTQALLLYQIIRLFDGDIAARASAERAIPAVENSALILLNHVQWDVEGNPPDLPFHPIAPTKAFWTDWILQESIRRTLLLTFYLTQAYRVLSGQKGLACDGRLGLCHSWTLSAHLWHARSPLAFADAWKNKKHFVLRDSNFAEIWDGALAEDIEAFGRIFITSYLGIEEAEGWFMSRGGRL